MANVVFIPTQTDGTAYYTQRTNLDGQDYQFEFAWSVREARWYFSLLDTSGNPLAGPIKVLTNWPMFSYYHDRAGFPPGEMIATSVNPDDSPPGIDELGLDRRVTLTYFGIL